MTGIDSIEQRLRRTFQLVADQPVPPLGDPEPWRNAPKSPSRRPRQLAVGLAVVVVIGLVAFGVAHGPRSSRTTPGTRPGVSGPTGGLRAVVAPARPLSPAALEEAAAAMASRLRALGDTDSTVSTDRGTLVITGPTLTRDQVRLVGSTGSFSIRPVLCGAPAYSAPATPPAPGTNAASTPLPACEAQYATTASNLAVNTNSGIPANTIGPDPIFAPHPSTRDDDPSSTVLLPADPAIGTQQYPRFVLGPAQLSGSNLDVASSQGRLDQQNGAWVVDITLASSSATQWDVVAQRNFHAFIAVDLDGEVLSAPLIQPNQSAFASFEGRIEVSVSGDNFTAAAEAKSLAAVIGSGPLPVPFNLQSLTSRN